MDEFVIRLGSVQDVEDFVGMATGRPYPIFLDDGQHRVNGKSFMEMFCLSLTKPLKVVLACDEASRLQFYQDAQRFRVGE